MDSTEANESLVMSEFSDVYLRCPLKNAIHQWFKVRFDTFLLKIR